MENNINLLCGVMLLFYNVNVIVRKYVQYSILQRIPCVNKILSTKEYIEDEGLQALKNSR